MYPNMYNKNMYYTRNNLIRTKDDRFIAPLLIGGLTGYALGKNKNNNTCCYFYSFPYNMNNQMPVPYNQINAYPYNTYYNNFYY